MWCLLHLLLVLLVGFVMPSLQEEPSNGRSDGVTLTVRLNSSVRLPCLPTSEMKGSSAVIVLWYRDQNPEPFYSYDLRQNGLVRHWNDDSVFGSRAYFEESDMPLRLRVHPVLPEDEGSYTCRVDYERGPSKTALIYLRVVVPPSKPTMTDQRGVEVSGVIGPYFEGNGTLFTCRSFGGRPPPSMKWLRDGNVLETTYSVDSQGRVTSLLHLQRMTRDLLDATFACRADNNNETDPLETSVKIDMILAPLNVHLTRKGSNPSYVLEGKLEEIECTAVGSRPAPVITWWRDGSVVFPPNVTEVKMANRTLSTLSIQPKLADHGSRLTCRVANPVLGSHFLESSMLLNVHYPPKVKLSKGIGLNPTAVREGADFYLECAVGANPPAYKIRWTLEGRDIIQNMSSGVIISNQTLVLQGVSKSSAGRYQCRAINLHGEGISNIIPLNVLYSPVCSRATSAHVEVRRKSTARVTCSVEAVPRNVTFKWQFNSSGGIIEIDRHRFSANGTRSVLPYTPASPGDFGLLLCFAQNEIGNQERPCVINVTAVEPTKLLKDCQIHNQTSHSLLVVCEAVATSLQPNFVLEVKNFEDESPVTSVKNQTPHFLASGLLPGTAYLLKVSATSSAGESEPIRLTAFTVKMAEKRMGVQKQKNGVLSSFLPVMVALVVSLLSAAIVVPLLVILTCRRHSRRGGDKNSQLPNYSLEDRIEVESNALKDPSEIQLRPIDVECRAPYLRPIDVECRAPYLRPIDVERQAPYLRPIDVECRAPYLLPVGCEVNYQMPDYESTASCGTGIHGPLSRIVTPTFCECAVSPLPFRVCSLYPSGLEAQNATCNRELTPGPSIVGIVSPSSTVPCLRRVGNASANIQSDVTPPPGEKMGGAMDR